LFIMARVTWVTCSARPKLRHANINPTCYLTHCHPRHKPHTTVDIWNADLAVCIMPQ